MADTNNMARKAAGILALAAVVKAQSACTLTAETHPSLKWEECTSDGTCTSVSGSVVVDANWRWTHDKDSSTNCYTGNEWDSTLCPDDATCTSNCCVDGANYESTYGVTTSDTSVKLDFVTGSNIGSRLYLMGNDSSYQGFTLLGNEFTFDVDVSNLPCGLNGALYFVSMDLDGGASKYPNNTAGAAYGTGYCDSQCPRDLKFSGGNANVDNWEPSSNDANSGVGHRGACCTEMDIWEANKISTALTPHPCKTSAYHTCSGDNCGGTYSSSRYASDCDPDGCDFNPFRQGNETFYGEGKTIDTSSTITVVTQFVEESGALSAIKRFYVQNDVVIANSESTISGNSGYNSITEEFCTTQKSAFGDDDIFTDRGGFTALSSALADPMVLVLSVWDDHYANMLWLDSTYPVNKTGEAGAARGSCATSSGVPSDVESSSASSSVVYSNIKFGPIGSTFNSAGTSSSSGSTSSGSGSGSGSGSYAAASAATSSAAAANVATSASRSAAAATSAGAEASTSSAAAATSSAAAASTAAVETESPGSYSAPAYAAGAAGAEAEPTSVASSAAAASTYASQPKTCKKKRSKGHPLNLN